MKEHDIEWTDRNDKVSFEDLLNICERFTFFSSGVFSMRIILCVLYVHNQQTNKIHNNNSAQKPKYQTVDWAIKTRRCFVVVVDEEEVENIILPLRISQAIYIGDEDGQQITMETTAPVPDAQISPLPSETSEVVVAQ